MSTHVLTPAWFHRMSNRAFWWEMGWRSNLRCKSPVFDAINLRILKAQLEQLSRQCNILLPVLAMIALISMAGSGVSPAFAQQTVTKDLYGGLIEVDIPEGFEELRLTEMELTFPSLPLPDYVYSDALRTTLLAVSIINNPDTNVDMLTYTAEWAKALEGTLPEFNWDQRRVARIEGRPWIVWQYNARTINQFKEPENSSTVMFMSILSKDVMVLVLGHAPRGIFAKNMQMFQDAVTSLNLSINSPQMSNAEAAGQ